jgi:hypothetical protein
MIASVTGPTTLARAADIGPTTTVSPPSATTAITALPMPSGIELPNSGQAPTFSGDRGGWAQLTLFGVMTAGMLAIFVRIGFAVRERTKSRRLATGA